MLDLSVIIISYNTKALLLECLRSMKKYTKNVTYEVIIVDNNSSDGSQNIDKEEKIIKNLKIIKNKENLGFAKANNQAINLCQGKFVLLLNSDTVFSENTLGKMVEWYGKHPSIGVASCTLKNPDGTIQATGGSFPSIFKVFLWSTFLDDLPFITDIFGSFHPHTPGFFTKSTYYLKDHEQDWVTGAFFMIRKEVIEKVGLLNEDFFMYVEELEYCFRVKKIGWKVCYTTSTSITHIGRASGTSLNAILGEYKGLILFYNKHKSKFERLVLMLLLKWSAIFRFILFSILNDKKGTRDVYLKALAYSA